MALQGGRAARTTAAPSSGSTSTSAASCASGSKDSNDPKDAPLQHLTWDYPTSRRGRRAESPRRCSRRSRAATTDGQPLDAYKQLQGRRVDDVRAAGSTAARSPTASTSRRGASRTGSRRRPRPSGAGRGPRTVASSTTAPQPIPTASRGRSGRSSSGGTTREEKWTGDDVPDFDEDKRAGLPAGRTARRARRRSAATIRSSCRPTAAAGSYVPQGLMDGPLPAHYEPQESPFREPALPEAAREPGAAARNSRTRIRTTRSGTTFPYVRDDLPPDRAPHRRRHVAFGSVPRRAAAARCSSRCIPTSRASVASSTAAGRRSRRRARRSKRA